MAGSVNKVILVGSLGKDPETRRTQDGKLIVTLLLPTSEAWRDKSGERREKTEWHTVVIFNEALAKVADSYLKKGSKVYVEGQLQTREWTDKEDIKRYKTEVVLQNYGGNLTIMDSRQTDRNNDERPARRDTQQPARNQEQRRAPVSDPDLDDEVPF